MSDKLFTPRSARRAVERLRPQARTMSTLFKLMEGKHTRAITCDQSVDPGYFSLLVRFFDAVRALQRAGAMVKDPRTGLLDFPARRDGRVVFLCWKLGEPSLDHWHETNAGYAGRRALDDDGPWEV